MTLGLLLLFRQGGGRALQGGGKEGVLMGDLRRRRGLLQGLEADDPALLQECLGVLEAAVERALGLAVGLVIVVVDPGLPEDHAGSLDRGLHPSAPEALDLDVLGRGLADGTAALGAGGHQTAPLDLAPSRPFSLSMPVTRSISEIILSIFTFISSGLSMSK